MPNFSKRTIEINDIQRETDGMGVNDKLYQESMQPVDPEKLDRHERNTYDRAQKTSGIVSMFKIVGMMPVTNERSS